MSPRTTVFMLLRATPRWHAMPQDERHAVLDDVFARVFSSVPGVSLRHYDAGAFGNRYSAVVVWETADMAAYREAVALLRDHEFFARPCFELLDTIVGAEHDGAESKPVPLWAAAA